MKDLFLKMYYYIYVAIALNPLFIIYILKNQNISFWIYNFHISEIVLVLFVVSVSFLFSYLFIYCVYKINKTYEEHTYSLVQIAELKYIPIYITYFVIGLSIPDDWGIFVIIFFMIYFLILKGKFSYFNPYLLFTYNFYELEIDMNEKEKEYAIYTIFLISKKTIKAINKQENTIRLNDFTFLDTNEGE